MLGRIRSCFVFVVMVSACELIACDSLFPYFSMCKPSHCIHSTTVRSNIAGSVAGSRELGGTPHWAHNPKLYRIGIQVLRGVRPLLATVSVHESSLDDGMVCGSLSLSTILFRAELIDDIFLVIDIHWFQEAIDPTLLSLHGLARFCKL